MHYSTNKQKRHVVILLLLMSAISGIGARSACAQSALEYMSLQTEVQGGLQKGVSQQGQRPAPEPELTPEYEAPIYYEEKLENNQDIVAQIKGFFDTFLGTYSPVQICCIFFFLTALFIFINKK